jgi:ADP-ribose pyrophosphatase YjhB (NUDIX family)
MRESARAILIAKNGRFVFMKRNKPDTEYYKTIGGGLEPGESAEDALRRELLEESGSVIESARFAFDITDAGELHHIYIAYEKERLVPTGEEWARNTPKNKHEIVEVARDKICDINLLPKEIKDYILSGM